MYTLHQQSRFWLLAALIYDVASGRATIEERDLVVNVTKYNYTIERPFTIPPKGNGLPVAKPNMILFMPDQLRYDAVGVFGNEVRHLCTAFLVGY